jgi:energy-coupling factor transport system substrate-specific component
MNEKKLNIKDLINVGIFLAISLVVGVIIAMILGTNPFTFLFVGIVGALVNGVVMMVFFSRIKKKNVFLVYVIVYAVLSLFLGMGYFPAIFTLIFGVMAELVLRKGNYKSKTKAILAYGIYSISSMGAYVPYYFSTASYVESRRASFGEAYADGLVKYSGKWIFVILTAATLACGLLGGLIGTKLFKKHFEKSGIA